MNTTQASTSTRFRVGLFTVLGLALIGAVTVFVNDKPFWWRPCQLVHINVEDATGLKTKSPIRSLGLEIGYLHSVELSETFVRLGICITAPVEVLPSTRAYIRGEGFLGDKFVELKPVKYTGARRKDDQGAPAKEDAKESQWAPTREPQARVEPDRRPAGPLANAPAPPLRILLRGSALSAGGGSTPASPWRRFLKIWDGVLATGLVEAEAFAEEEAQAAPKEEKVRPQREIPVGEKSQDVQHLVDQVDGLVNEMTSLTNNLKEAINPRELRSTMQQLNRTLENASRTLSPEGGLNTTAQRTLAKLEDAIEQLRDMMTRVNKGEGSVGMLLNDPSYAEEIKEAIRNVNRLLSKVGGIRFVVDLGGEEIPALDGGRGWFRLGIWPKPDRYYLLGITVDPRGKQTITNTTTVTGGLTTTTQTTQVEQGGLLLTGMLGKVFYRRLDLAAGIFHGDGAVSVGLWIGPHDREEMAVLRNDIYTRGKGEGVDDRITLQLRPFIGTPVFSTVYLRGGLEGVKQVGGKTDYSYGAGITFDDEDIKLLFALR